MPRANKRFGGIPSLDTREEPCHGRGCGRCSPQVRNVVVEIVGSQDSGDVTDGSILRHDPYLWHVEEAIQRKSARLYGQEQRES